MSVKNDPELAKNVKESTRGLGISQISNIQDSLVNLEIPEIHQSFAEPDPRGHTRLVRICQKTRTRRLNGRFVKVVQFRTN